MDQALIIPAADWTLFLDRDGVINIEKKMDYIHTWDEFVFYPDAIEAIAIFAKLFKHIIIVTNQKGIGKGVTKVEDLEQIHHNMTAAISAAGGRIDAIYYCPDLDDDSPRRKPNAGMAFDAVRDFPAINLSRSFIVGNNISDMQFGRNAGMHTVFLRSTHPDIELPGGIADMEANSLLELARKWQAGR